MAEPVVSFVVERLGDILIEEAKFIHGVSGQVQQIYDELRWMKAFLKDADDKQGEDNLIREWVHDVRTLAYDAGDVLESFVLRVESKRVGGIKNILKRYLCILNECVDLHIVSSEILDIRSRITELRSHKDTYGIKSLSEASSSGQLMLSQTRQTYSHIVEDDFVGFEGDVEDLVEHLVKDGDGSYPLVSICGMGGSGKSTIAKKIYNHTKVKRRFEALAWICVSQIWQASSILQQILTNINPEEKDKIKKLNDAEMIKELFELQQKKSCLVILDDIWKKEAWDCIKEAFPKKNTTSKILLTSRNKIVASHVNPNGILFEPRELSDDEAWVLLKKKAFSVHHYIDQKELKEMETLGIEMVRQCKGHPLGIVVLGGILVSKRHLDDWKKVRSNIKSVIRKGESRENENGGVLHILELSYTDLPHYLKPCFLYLSKFREDTDIDAEGLYQLWMAESMVLSAGKGEGETMMDVAESYLGELAQRCMVQVTLNDEQGYAFKQFSTCHMHDMIRELCLSKAKEEDFFQVIDFKNENGVGSTSSSVSARRVAIYFEGQNVGSRVVSINKNSCRRLRSLLLLNEGESRYNARLPIIIKSHLSDFKLLRSLAIEGFHPDDLASFSSIAKIIRDHFKLPNAIGSLVHLRYLSLKNMIFIMFPTCIKNLKQLQTLALSGCVFLLFTQCMENVLSRMTKLQHLYLPEEEVFKFGGIKLMLDNSTNLEILDNYDTSYCRIEDLTKFIKLRKFGASISSNHLHETKRMMTFLLSKNSKNIREASLGIGYCIFATEEWQEILSQLLNSSCVNRLTLFGPIQMKLPGYDNNSTLPSKLTQLSLSCTKLEEDPMSILQAIPNLLSLDLMDAFEGREMTCSSNGFLHLKSLVIQRMKNLESLKVESGAMPRLSALDFVILKSFKAIPDGLRFVTTLQTLQIIYMPEEFEQKAWAVKNGGQGEDFDKIGHVASIIIVNSSRHNTIQSKGKSPN